MRHRHIVPLLVLVSASACQDQTPFTSPVSDAPRLAVTGGVQTELRAGYGYVCRLRGGVITCYGDADDGQPIGVHRAATGSFVGLTAGQTHACGLRSDGAVECFGSNRSGEAPPVVRAATGTFTRVSAGLDHTCAVRSDGLLECWGSNGEGAAPPLARAQAGGFTEVTATANRTCALRTDAVVECRGFRLGDPSVRPSPTGSYAALGESVGATICVVRGGGLPECWGNQPSFKGGAATQVVVGAAHECVLHPGGIAECAGYPWSWQGPEERSVTDRTWARITAGSYHTCGLRPDGYFQCFGVQSIGSDAPDVVPGVDPPKSSLRYERMRVDWRDVNLNESGTELERSVADGGGGPTSWTPVATVGANRAWFTDSGATPGATYIYRIHVCNDAGCSSWQLSNPTRFPTGAPPAPAVSAAGYVCGFSSCARATWTADNTFVDTFRIQRRVNTGPRWEAWQNTAALDRGASTFNDYGLTPGARYQYRVAACNIRGCSAYVASEMLIAPLPPPPAAPATLTADAMGNYVYLVWGDVVNETRYEIDRRQHDGTAWGAWTSATVRTMNVTSDDEAVSPGALYQYRIRACNQGGCSGYTNSAPTQT